MCKQEKNIKNNLELEIMKTGIWWTLTVKHKKTNRIVQLSYDSLKIKHMKIKKDLFKYSDIQMFNYLKTGL